MKMMGHLTVPEQKAWLQIYSKIYNLCQTKDRAREGELMSANAARAPLHVSRVERPRPARGTTRRCSTGGCVA